MSALDDGLDQVFGTVEPPTVIPAHERPIAQTSNAGTIGNSWSPRGTSYAHPYEDASSARPSDDPPPLARFKLLSSVDLRGLSIHEWALTRVLPLVGLAAIFGPSGSGKSFIGLDLLAALAEGRDWFGHRVKKALRCIYVQLEGQSGACTRVSAWEAEHGSPFPESVRFVLDPFRLTEQQNVLSLAAHIEAAGGADVIMIDTLNRAAPEVDENSSRDMGKVLEGCKELQDMTGSLVILVHHSGKDSTKGMRGHSSLFAALDAVIEVSRTDDRREWSVAKSKDGEDGEVHPFRLEVVEVGQDEDGEPITSCVVRSDDSTTPRRPKLPKTGNQRIVYDALGPLFKESHTFGKAGAPAVRPCINLDEAILIVRDRLTVEPKRRTERAREAITGLVARGVVGCNEDWIWLI